MVQPGHELVKVDAGIMYNFFIKSIHDGIVLPNDFIAQIPIDTGKMFYVRKYHENSMSPNISLHFDDLHTQTGVFNINSTKAEYVQFHTNNANTTGDDIAEFPVNSVDMETSIHIGIIQDTDIVMTSTHAIPKLKVRGDMSLQSLVNTISQQIHTDNPKNYCTLVVFTCRSLFIPQLDNVRTSLNNLSQISQHCNTQPQFTQHLHDINNNITSVSNSITSLISKIEYEGYLRSKQKMCVFNNIDEARHILGTKYTETLVQRNKLTNKHLHQYCSNTENTHKMNINSTGGNYTKKRKREHHKIHIRKNTSDESTPLKKQRRKY